MTRKGLLNIPCIAVLIACIISLPVMAEMVVSGGSAGGGGGASSVAMAYAPVPIPVPIPDATAINTTMNISRLSISPQYLQFRLQPGEKKEVAFSIQNRDKITVSLQPHLEIMPYSGPYGLDEEWVSVSPAGVEIAPGETMKFMVTMTIPEGTGPGFYSGMLALTGEQIPTPYNPYPSYVHVLNLNAEVYSPPVVTIDPYSLEGALEAGKGYDYDVTLRNSGKIAIPVSPRIEQVMYAGPVMYGPSSSPLTDDSFRLTSPDEIPAQGETVLAVHIDVPSGARGYYYGVINLGINDPSVSGTDLTIPMNFLIWEQPAGPFEKEFVVDTDSQLTIELSASTGLYGSLPTRPEQKYPEPSFDISLRGPGGTIRPDLVKKTLKGSVDLGLSNPSVPFESGPYQESGVQYVSTYSATARSGSWALLVTPRNAVRFDYTVITEPAKTPPSAGIGAGTGEAVDANTTQSAMVPAGNGSGPVSSR